MAAVRRGDAGTEIWPIEHLVNHRRSYVLLAPGGLGKSVTLNWLSNQETGVDPIDLRQNRTSIESVVKRAVIKDQPCFLDSVDEAMQFDNELAYRLSILLSDPSLCAVPWRLACRPSWWGEEIDEQFAKALDGFQRLELLPLDDGSVRALANSEKVEDVEEFLDEVSTIELTHLLASPMHARDLMRHWVLSGGLPETGVAGIEHTVGHLLIEHGVHRPVRKQSDGLLRVAAERLAALATFSDVSGFTAGNSARERSVLAAGAVRLDPEPGVVEQLSADSIRAVLGTELFAPAGGGSVWFAHQSYADFLAAAYLVRRKVDGAGLRPILGASGSGLIPRRFAEVLGWLMVLSDATPHDLAATNVKWLLKTAAIGLTSAPVRERLVGALFSGIQRGRIHEAWDIDTHALDHPGLAGQLRDALEQASTAWEYQWACYIVADCNVTEMADDMLRVALDAAQPEFVRSSAVLAFVTTTPSTRWTPLVPLLFLDEVEDPEDELLGLVIIHLLEAGVAPDDTARALRPPRCARPVGDYARMLDAIPTLIQDSHLLTALEVAIGRAPDHPTAEYKQLLLGLLDRAWKRQRLQRHLDLIPVLERLGARIGVVLQSDRLPWSAAEDIHHRREFAVAMLSRFLEAAEQVVALRLLTDDDIGWLIDTFGDLSRDELGVAGQVLVDLGWRNTAAKGADAILNVGREHPASDVLAVFQGMSLLPTSHPSAQDVEDRGTPETSTPPDNSLRYRTPLSDTLRADVTAIAGDRSRSLDQREAAFLALLEDGPHPEALDAARAAATEATVPWPALFIIANLAPLELVIRWAERGALASANEIEVAGGVAFYKLDDEMLATFARLLLDARPYSIDPNPFPSFFENGFGPDEPSWARNSALQELAERGRVDQLLSLTIGRAGRDQEYLHYLIQRTRERQVAERWQPLKPSDLVGLLSTPNGRLVRNGDDLTAVLVEQLAAIQSHLHDETGYRYVWDGEPGKPGARPKDEDTISDWVRSQLELRLRHVLIQREVQVRRPKPRGVGTRVDITASALGEHLAQVVVEAKRVDNPRLSTALGDQLVAAYLDPTGIPHGIYLVYWIRPEIRPGDWSKAKAPDRVGLREALTAQARTHSPTKNVEVIVLDIGPPS